MTQLLNGYIVAALHRVVSNAEHVERFSLPFLVKGTVLGITQIPIHFIY